MKKLAVLGHPIGHTLSPVMHNASIKALGLAAEYEYGKLDVPPGELMVRLAKLPSEGYAGVNLTIPLKEVAFQGLEKLWLLPVYAASEKPLAGGTSEDLVNRFSDDWKNRIKIFQTLEKVWQDIQSELRTGDVLLIIGAGDIEQLAERARR